MKVPGEALTMLGAAASKVAVQRAQLLAGAAPRLPRRLQGRLSVADAERGLGSSSSSSSASTASSSPRDPRRLAADAGSAASCDASFLKCVLSPTCRSCFQTLQENKIDWTNVVPETPCQDVLGFLVSGGHCTSVRDAGHDEQDVFCEAFDGCVVWDDDDAVEGGATKEAAGGDPIDCKALTECRWEGMHEHFLGDGVCHDAIPGCYNSKACNYDGGDCCEDTCHYPGGAGGSKGGDDNSDRYGECGLEGFACRDPSSIKCQPTLARAIGETCAIEEDEAVVDFDDDAFKEEEKLPECGSDETLYRLVQYDSWGDGWDETVLTLKEHDASTSKDPIYKGGLEYGSQGTVHLCLAKKEPKCYHVTVENGVWGNEISWELRPFAGGAPALAAGGSPSDCTVPVAGEVKDCPSDCDKARPDTKINDPNYRSYKDMEACIEKKCLIQVGNCAGDEGCSECMGENSPDYCYANDNFNVLIDCSICSCAEKKPGYCAVKQSGASSSASSMNGSSAATHGGVIKPVATPTSSTSASSMCTPEQTLQGTDSLVDWADCADVDEMMVMVTNFDNDNFGALDLFEACAHTYANEPMHGGKNAMDCMKILNSLIVHNNEDDDWKYDDDDKYDNQEHIKNSKGEVVAHNIEKAIAVLAHELYYNAEEFCECTGDINKDTPTCSSFVNFKTLLYEAVDACRSLDAIDCAAWAEFHPECRKNVLATFDKIDFDNQGQCTFVNSQCGGAGPFPSFRRLDCGKEVSKSAWDFHQMYERGCLKKSSPSYPSPSPPSSSSGSVPEPVAPTSHTIPAHISPTSSSTANKKQYKPYGANGASDTEEKKEYHSDYQGDDSEEEADKYTQKKTHHFVRTFFLLALVALPVGYVVLKRRRDNFNYMRFRQMREARNYAGGAAAGGGGGGQYSGVSMSDSCSFEPPTLPPTPSDNTTMI
ncbi:hypothetical protein ACHAWF_007229 [Thalassiosira exigua]